MKKLRNLHFYFKKAKKMAGAYMAATLLRNFFFALLSLVDIAGLGIVIDALVSKRAFGDVIRLIAFYVLINLAVNLTGHFLFLLENRSMRRATNVLQYKYMEDCIAVDYHYVQDGNVLNLKRNSMLAHPAFSLGTFGELLNALIKLLGTLSIFFMLSPLFIVVLTVLSVLIITLTVYTQRCDYQFRIDCADDERRLKYFYEIMTKYRFAKEIRINNAAGYISGRYRATFSEHMRKFRLLLRKKLGVNWLGILLSCLQNLLMYVYFTYKVSVGALSVADYTVALASAVLFTSALLALFKSIGAIGNVLDSVDIYREYEETIKLNSLIRETSGLPERKINAQNAMLCFENVSFRYPNAKTDTLRNITFSVKPGKRLAVVGLNGAGKTTLIKLILRLYKPTEGKITLGGVDILEIPYQQYSRYLSAVLQDFALFAYSVKENIVFDRECDGVRLFDSIQKSGLADKLSKLPRGVDTSVNRDLDDCGIEFSGGEGQKLATAHAIYKDAALFILDEPTAALDPIAEAALFSKFDEITRGKTTLFITHRLSSTTFCDDILVICDGTIAEQGSHETLLAKPDGTYAKLYHAQMQYYEKTKETGESV